jgi:hypothetical protein
MWEYLTGEMNENVIPSKPHMNIHTFIQIYRYIDRERERDRMAYFRSSLFYEVTRP